MGWFKDPKTGLICMMWLSLVYFFVEIIVGYMTNSMALVADSFHMLGDVAAMVIAFVSVKMSPKKWSKNTFGWARAEVLGALVNAVFLVALCFSITIEAIKRIVEPEEIHNPAMLAAVGGLGLVINLIGLAMLFEHGGQGVHHGHTHGLSGNTHTKLTQLNTGSSTSGGGAVANGTAAASAAANSNSNSTDDNENNSFMQRQAVPEPIKPVATTVAKKKKAPAAHHHGHGHGHSHGGGSGNDRNMNMHGVYLHVLSDALGSIIVVISALVVWLTEWEYRNYLDPALSVLLVVLMLRSVWPLLRESAMILLQTVPTHIQVDAIQQRLLENVDGVLAVHEFHVWQLAGDRIIASAHIRCRNLSEYMKIAEKVKEFFHHEGIHSTTIQPEFVELEQQSVTDGVSTNLNISGSHDSCVLDCPTTDDGCVQATCCQNNNKMPTLSPTSSPFLCRQRTITSRQNSDIESGSLLTSAVVAPPSPIATGVTLPLTASASHMAAGPPPLAIVTATSETGGSSSGSAAAGVATITPTSIVVAASSSASTSTAAAAAAATLSTSAASAISGSSSNLHQTASAQLQNQQQQPIV